MGKAQGVAVNYQARAHGLLVRADVTLGGARIRGSITPEAALGLATELKRAANDAMVNVLRAAEARKPRGKR